MTRYGLEVLPTWPHNHRKPGDIITLPQGCTRAYAQQVCEAMRDPEHYRVVELGPDLRPIRD